jgi:phenylalanyl-tRNA synthetase alpha subunit
MMQFPVAPPGATMAISFQSDEEVLRKLRERLRRMSDAELIKFGKEVRRLAENPFQRQLEEARKEWKRRGKNNLEFRNGKTSLSSKSVFQKLPQSPQLTECIKQRNGFAAICR